MDQKISIKIAGRLFNLTASSPEAEELYRLAAGTINNRFASYTRSHPGKNVSDLPGAAKGSGHLQGGCERAGQGPGALSAGERKISRQPSNAEINSFFEPG